MAKECKGPRYGYLDDEGDPVSVACEMPRGHDGPHAAWTWERAILPRVEWSNEEAVAEPKATPDPAGAVPSQPSKESEE